MTIHHRVTTKGAAMLSSLKPSAGILSRESLMSCFGAALIPDYPRLLLFRLFLLFLLAVSAVQTSLSAATAGEIPSELRERQEKLYRALDRVRGAVVGVSDGSGVGSGVVVQPDGIVLTAAHVVDTGRRQGSQRAIITFPDGSEYEARVLGKNRDHDATVLKIDDSPVNGGVFPYAEMGKSSELDLGEWCFAMGHPGGYRKDRTAPVRVGRILSVGDRTIVSDCSIVLGDSGGPLFDLDGKVIGIHSMITPLIIENRHVAVDCWHRDWQKFLNSERWGTLRAEDNHLVVSSFFGVGLKWKNFTAEVSQVMPDSPADAAGLKPGDLLRSIRGERFADRLDLGTLLSQIPDETSVDVVVLRNDREEKLPLVTGSQEEGLEEQQGERGALERQEDDEARETEIAEQLSPGRRIGPMEKRAPEQVRLFDPVVQDLRGTVVAIRDGGPIICLGTVMSSDGYILTKASEIVNAIEPQCVLPDGRSMTARQVAVDYFYDLALLHVSAVNLRPVIWETEKSPAVGTLCVIQDSRGNPLIPTVVSVATRSMPNSTKGFLGVRLARDEQGQNGIRIENVIPSGAAARSGLKAKDIVLSIDGISMVSQIQMMQKVSQYKPGERIAVRYMREDMIRTMEIVLTPRFDNSEDAMLDLYQNSRPEMQGQFASIHSGGYPEVLQHEADVFPNQVGGPLLSLSGRAVGLNIARSDRVVSYAIPADSVLRVFRKLRDQDKEKPL
ncbi:MAG: S1C family serine protease [Planctomyces sp.]